MNPFDVEDIKEKKKSTLSPGMTKNLSTFCSEDSLKFNICQKISPKNNNHNISMNSNLHSDNLINLSNYSSLLSINFFFLKKKSKKLCQHFILTLFLFFRIQFL